MVFEKYAQYYDLLYKDKDYRAETDYIFSLIKKYQPETSKILEFGAGSGIHGRILANAGFHVSGIERSQDMIDLGHSSNLGKDQNSNFSCIQGDCTSTILGDDFDAVISLFHVLSYQTSNEEVLAMLKNAHRQLKPGGVFIFDYWYAPAVWNMGPTLRVKRVSNQQLAITRIAEPECFRDQNIVHVNYQTFVEDLKSNYISQIKETHEMRAFETEEIKEFASQTGFTLLHSEEWLTSHTPSKETWGVCTVLKKN
jgi:SAM-dependent methyltransferase